jgi:hypothetical protein
VGRDGEVEDLDLGEGGVLVSSAKMERLIHAFHEANCAKARWQP